MTARTFSQGNLITQTDPRGIVTVYGYDTSNLYLNCINQATTSTTCQNNGKRNFAMVRDQASGLLQSLTDSDNSGTVSHTYDLVGRLTSSTDTAGGAVQRSVWYGYNDLARRLVVAVIARRADHFARRRVARRVDDPVRAAPDLVEQLESVLGVGVVDDGGGPGRGRCHRRCRCGRVRRMSHRPGA